MNDLEPWLEWKARCALERCSVTSSGTLMGFLQSRLLGYVRHIDANLDLPKDPKYAGALFESKYAHGIKRDGKTYKEWIFSTQNTDIEPSFSMVAGRVTRLMLNLAREITCTKRGEHGYLQHTHAEYEAGDNDQKIDDKWTQGAVVDAAFLAWLNEVAEIAGKEAALLLDQCTRRERWVLYARAAGVALTDAALHSSTGLKKTALFDAEKKFEERVSRHLHKEFPNESPEDFSLLLRATLEALVHLVSENNGGMPDAGSL